jgi:hypothetical protein
MVVAGIMTDTYLAWRHSGDHPLLGAAAATRRRPSSTDRPGERTPF